MLDFTQIKHPQALLIVGYALLLLVPVPTYLFFFDMPLFDKLDAIKLLIVSISISGLNTLALFPLGAAASDGDDSGPVYFLIMLALINVAGQILFFMISGISYLINYFWLAGISMPLWNILAYVILYLLALGSVFIPASKK